MDSLILTRVIPPQLPPNIISRDRLQKLLEESSHAKLILLCSPAGYGKTTLVLNYLIRNRMKFSWLGIHEDMNNFYTFAGYLANSLKHINPNFGNMTDQVIEGSKQRYQLAKNLKTIVNNVLGTFINEICENFTQEITIVFDDLGNLENAQWLGLFFDSLFANLPPNVHLIITSREVPNFNTNILYAKRSILKLDTENLTLDSTELSEILERVYDLKAEKEQIRFLETNFGGWVTGIHLLMQSYGKDFTKMKLSGEKVLSDVFDFFANDIFKSLNNKVKDFLLDTALLDQFEPELSDAILQRHDSMSIIEELLNKNIFILQNSVITADKELKYVYSYQVLFRKFLLSKIYEIRTKNEINKTLIKIYEYFCGKNNFVNAISYALQAENNEIAVPLIIKHFQAMFDEGKLDILWQWISKIDEETLSKEPDLMYIRARLIQFYKGDIEGSLQVIDQAIGLYTKRKALNQVIKCNVFKIRNLINLGQIKESVSLLKELTNKKTSPDNRSKLLYYLAFAYFQTAQYDESLRLLDQAVEVCSKNDFKDTLKNIFKLYGHIHLIRGDYNRSILYYEKTVNITDLVIDRFETSCNLVLLYSQSGKFEEAANHLAKCHDVSQQIPIPFVQTGYLLACQAYRFEYADYEETVRLLEQINAIASKTNHKYYKYLSYRLLADTYYFLNRLGKAEEYYDLAFSFVDEENKLDKVEYSVMKALQMKKSSPKKIIDSVLVEADQYYAERNFTYNRSQALYHLADYYFQTGMYTTSLHYIKECLTICKEREYVSFLQRELLDSRVLMDFAIANNVEKEFVKSIFDSVFSKLDADWLSTEARLRLSNEIPQLYDLSVVSFGKLEFFTYGKAIPEKEWTKKKWKMILMYLMLSPKREITKDKIIDMFYSDTQIESAENIFHQIISRYRALFRSNSGAGNGSSAPASKLNNKKKKEINDGQTTLIAPQIILYENKTLRLNPDLNYCIDYFDFEDNYKLSKRVRNIEDKLIYAKKAITLYNGEFLDGFYDRWCEDIRNEVRVHFISLCEDVISAEYNSAHYDECLEYCEILQRHDKLNESVFEHSIRSYLSQQKQRNAREKMEQMINVYNKELGGMPAEIMERMKLLLS